jgi:transaldolase
VEQVIQAGINVNVTLLFSVQSYVETAWAYIRGLEARAAEGKDIRPIASVASFFLSRIDSKIDDILEARLQALGDSDPALAKRLRTLGGKVAIANAKVAYQEYLKIIRTDRWKALSEQGAQVQRLLWASTGTKNPAYSDVMYVDALVGPDTVNTLPPGTLAACADHCDVENRVATGVEEAEQIIAALSDPEINIDLDQVMAELLEDGIAKFVQPFESLLQSLEEKVNHLATV